MFFTRLALYSIGKLSVLYGESATY